LTDVTGARFAGYVVIVNDKRLPGFRTNLQQYLLSTPGLEHVKVKADVGVSKSLLIKSGFTGRLNADENDGFHFPFIPLVPARSSNDSLQISRPSASLKPLGRFLLGLKFQHFG